MEAKEVIENHEVETISKQGVIHKYVYETIKNSKYVYLYGKIFISYYNSSLTSITSRRFNQGLHSLIPLSSVATFRHHILSFSNSHQFVREESLSYSDFEDLLKKVVLEFYSNPPIAIFNDSEDKLEKFEVSNGQIMEYKDEYYLHVSNSWEFNKYQFIDFNPENRFESRLYMFKILNINKLLFEIKQNENTDLEYNEEIIEPNKMYVISKDNSDLKRYFYSNL